MSSSSPMMASVMEGVSARRTESLDASAIQALADSNTYRCYGRVNEILLIEKANLAISLVDDKNDLIGHMSLYEHPRWPETLNERHHIEWLQKHFQLPNCNAMNTLFLHYFVSKSDISDAVLSEILKTVFNAVPLLHFVVFVSRKDTERGDSMDKMFMDVEQVDPSAELEYSASVCHRHNHCPVLHIRGACVEDHDDLMPIFDSHNKHLNEIYGDFFLADMIEAQDDCNKCIVADVDNTAVGFMSLSTEVNVQLLVDSFELDVFNDLKCKKKFLNEVPKEEEEELNETPNPSIEVIKPPDSEGTELPAATPSLESTSSKKARKKSSKKKVAGKLSSQHLDEGSVAEFDAEKAKAEEESKPVPKKKKGKDVPKEPEYDIIEMESVLCIQLFCIDAKYETRSIDFLPMVFELFPDKDFVVMTVPHTVPEFPLLQFFQRATPKPASTLSQELYIFNKNGLLNQFNVRFCEAVDLPRISNLSSHIQGQEHLINDVERYLKYQRDSDGTMIKCYVAEILHQVVGVCLIRQEQETEYLRAHFNIEDFVYFSHHDSEEHGRLYHFVLNPIFQHYSKYFLKDVLYQAKISCLYYPMYPDYISNVEKPHSLVTCLNDLVPASARRQPIYNLNDLGINAPVPAITSKLPDFALYHMNRKLTLEPKVIINIRIVIVGASDVGLSFLESLVFCPHLCFNNLTLVTEHPIPGNAKEDSLVNSFLSSRLCYSQRDHFNMALKTWVNVVQGKMTGIDRKTKNLTIDGCKKVPYDELMLCTGMQYQTSVPTNADITLLPTTSEALAQGIPSIHKGFTPDCVFTMNSRQDVESVITWTKETFLKSEGKAIIYGSSIDAYTCINGLLQLGVPGSRLVMVHPPSEMPNCFNNPHVENAMKKIFDQNGIECPTLEVHPDFRLARWNHGRKDSTLKVATFTSVAKPLEIECEAFFCFDYESVDYDAFKAMNNSCLVFDGRLVIDKHFRTNDPSILAAGSLTKFVRKYHNENWSHRNFNSKEIGQMLANAILQKFDPTLEDTIETNDREENLIPSYKEAKCVHAQLPGELFYLQIGKPATIASMQVSMSENDLELVTGDVLDDGKPDYFRVHINQYSKIETITCLSRSPLKTSNYLCLYNMHERYLNNLKQRFEDKLISDFYKFFDEAWCVSFFHDRFSDFRAEIRELFSTPMIGNQTSLEDRVAKLIQEDLILSSSQRAHLQDNFTGGGYKGMSEKRLLSYLGYNQYHLPMYARPGLV